MKKQKLMNLEGHCILLQFFSIATNTLRAYLSAANLYFAFLEGKSLQSIPIVDHNVSLFITDLWINKHHKSTSIHTQVSNLKSFFTKFFDVVVPFNGEQISWVLQGINRVDTGELKQATAIRGSHLRLLELHLLSLLPTQDGENRREDLSHHDIQLMTMFSMLQNGTFRISELLQLNWGDVIMIGDDYKISLPRSKAHKSGPPESVLLVNHAGDHTSAATWIQLYVTICPGTTSSWMFPNLKKPYKQVTSHQINKSIKEFAIVMHLDPTKVSSHSFRAGGTTDMVALKFKDSDIMKHVRWRSPSMLARYNRPTDSETAEKHKRKRYVGL